MADHEYLFIDGGCLRASVRSNCSEIFGKEDALSPHIKGLEGGRYQKIFYYDAVPGREHEESQAAYEARVAPFHQRFENIQSLDRVHIALGSLVGPNKRQKGVDVRLAVDMMSHAFRGKMTRATLFAGDADFTPLLRALVNEGLHVTLWHPPQANAELRGAADSARLFSFAAAPEAFSADGKEPAFQVNAIGGGHPSTRDVALFDKGGDKFAGLWTGDHLEIWWNHQSDQWQWARMVARTGVLLDALAAFQAIQGWNVGPEDALQITTEK